ncbi:hypothetical protein ABH953_003808 [Bacillus sp. RC236]
MLHPLKFPIPEGYSEFLLRAGYLRYGEKVEKINREEILADYDRKVVMYHIHLQGE